MAMFSVAADATIEIMTQIPTPVLATVPEAISLMVVIVGLRSEGWPKDCWSDKWSLNGHLLCVTVCMPICTHNFSRNSLSEGR